MTISLPPEGQRTFSDYLEKWAGDCPDKTWLRDRKGDEFTEWTWKTAKAEIDAVAAWLQQNIEGNGVAAAILSRNRAHWVMADMALAESGNVSVPIFTTLANETVEYILDFAEVKLLFVGESDNWENVRQIVSSDITIVAFPGVDPGIPHLRWDDLIAQCAGQSSSYQCNHEELVTIVFTSGTTGMPKGVMQTHDSMLIPMERGQREFQLP